MVAAVSRQAVTQHLTVREPANQAGTDWHERKNRRYGNSLPLQDICGRQIAEFETSRLKALHGLKKKLED